MDILIKNKMNKIKVILFDLDMTLIDSYSTVVELHQKVAKEYYNFDMKEEIIRKHWGLPTHELYPLIYNNLDTYENIHPKVSTIRKTMKFKAFKDTISTLQLLKNSFILGIITAFDTIPATWTLESADINPGFFQIIQGSDKTHYHKPDSRVFDPAITELSNKGFKLNQILYVGDAISDFQAAKGAKINFIAITTGFDNSDKFISAGLDKSYIISSLSELINKLK